MSDDFANDKLANRLDELSDAVTKGERGAGEFTMRIPAEPKRDADLVLAEAAKRVRRIAELEARERKLVELLDEARTTIDAFGYGLAKRQAAEAGHHTRKRMNSLLAKIDKEIAE